VVFDGWFDCESRNGERVRACDRSPNEVRPGGKANKVLSTLIIYVTEPVEVSLTPR
jgi:hypothetical protein